MIKYFALKKIVILTLQISFVVICLVYSFSGIDYHSLFIRIKNIDILLIIPTLFVVFFGYFVLAIRLMAILQKYSIHNFFKSLNASIIALGVNNIFPLKLGEIAKAIYLRNELKITMHKSFSLIIWERFSDINFIALLSFITITYYQPIVDLQPLFISVVILWVCFIIFLRSDFIYYKLLIFIPSSFQNFLNKLRSSLTAKRSVFNIVSIIILSLLIWMAYVFQVWFVLDQLLLIELTKPQFLIVFVVTLLGLSVPSVPGAIGVYEAAMVMSLNWFGIDKTEALMAGIVCHAFILIPSTLLSFIIISNMPIRILTFKKLLLKTSYQEVEK